MIRIRVSHEQMETFASNKDQIIIALLQLERINNMVIKEKAFQVNSLTDSYGRWQAFKTIASLYLWARIPMNSIK